MSDKQYEVGEPCFAKVKGYPMWPAEITALHGSRYEVFFFGTHEVARIAPKELLKYTPANLEKFNKPQFTSRRFYKEGLTEMEKFTNKSSSKRKSGTSSRSYSKKYVDRKADKVISSILKTTPKKSPTKSGPKPTVSITTPTGIPQIRGKDSNSEDEAEATETVDVMTEEVSDPLDMTPKRSPVVLLDSRDVNKSDGILTMPRKSPNKRKMEKVVEEPEEPSKKEDKVKMNISVSLEMNPDTFIRLARELPGLLSLAGVDMNSVSVNQD
jgi:hypothetical protein